MDGQETQCGICEGLPPGSTAQQKTELTKKRCFKQKGALGSRRTGREYMGTEREKTKLWTLGNI